MPQTRWRLLSLRSRSNAIRVGDSPAIFLPEAVARGFCSGSSPGPRVSRSATVMVTFLSRVAAL